MENLETVALLYTHPAEKNQMFRKQLISTPKRIPRVAFRALPRSNNNAIHAVRNSHGIQALWRQPIRFAFHHTVVIVTLLRLTVSILCKVIFEAFGENLCWL